MGREEDTLKRGEVNRCESGAVKKKGCSEGGVKALPSRPITTKWGRWGIGRWRDSHL